jgi:hypothetical protein
VTIGPSSPQPPTRGDPSSVARTRAGKRERYRCSFCQADLHTLDLTIPDCAARGERAPNGRFCSSRCRDCVPALAALHPSPLAPHAFIEQRARLTDQLLDLWRQHKGPDPALVLQGAQKAGRGLLLPPD